MASAGPLAHDRGTWLPFLCGQAPVGDELARRPARRASRPRWHPTKNGTRSPQDVLPGTHAYAWWRCKDGHSWRAQVVSRVPPGLGCPFCSGYRVTASRMLARLRPDLARQWHPTENGALTPRHVSPGSARNIWWKCPKGVDHVWQATVYSRAIGEGGARSARGGRASTDVLPEQNGHFPTNRATVHGRLPNVVHALRALPPDVARRPGRNVARGECAVLGEMALPREVGAEPGEHSAGGYTVAGAERAPEPLADARYDLRAPGVPVLAPPPSVRVRPGEDVLRRAGAVLRRMPLGREARRAGHRASSSPTGASPRRKGSHVPQSCASGPALAMSVVGPGRALPPDRERGFPVSVARPERAVVQGVPLRRQQGVADREALGGRSWGSPPAESGPADATGAAALHSVDNRALVVVGDARRAPPPDAPVGARGRRLARRERADPGRVPSSPRAQILAPMGATRWPPTHAAGSRTGSPRAGGS